MVCGETKQEKVWVIQNEGDRGRRRETKRERGEVKIMTIERGVGKRDGERKEQQWMDGNK